MGWIFLWPFLDKVFGFGFATAKEAAWIAGGSPTTGFLTYGTRGPFADVFQALAGNALIDWLFMIGLLLIGLALMFGIFMRLAIFSGSLMLLLMYLATIPPEHNPIIDDHIIYPLVLLSFLWTKPERFFSLQSLKKRNDTRL